jgi:hypothetical protein
MGDKKGESIFGLDLNWVPPECEPDVVTNLERFK